MSWDRTCCPASSYNYEYIDQSSPKPISSTELSSSSFLYEQYLTSLKHEQSDHLPYLFDNIIYPQPCSPPSPTNDSITYYQLDQTHMQQKSSQRFQPIIYHQLSLIEPPSSNIQQKLPVVKRFYYDTNMSNPTTTTVITTTSLITNTNSDSQVNHLPYARLNSIVFGTYEIWKEKILIGRKNHRQDVDVHLGSIPVISRIHFELFLNNGNEFHLKCRSKNGIFINNNFTKMSAIVTLPKQCTIRFPSTDISITFSSLLTSINRSISSEQQLSYLTPNQESNIKIECEFHSNLSQTSPMQSFTGSMNSKIDSNEIQTAINSPNQNVSTSSDSQPSENGTKPPFSYAQLIVQAILSSPDKQMTLSQIYNFISRQYPYYESNNRGWQNSIRHNLSLNRYFIRLARKENECGKGSFWSLDQTYEEKLTAHAYRHRKYRMNSFRNSSMIKLDLNDDFLVDIPTDSNSPTSQSNESFKRKRFDHDEIDDLMDSLLETIANQKR